MHSPICTQTLVHLWYNSCVIWGVWGRFSLPPYLFLLCGAAPSADVNCLFSPLSGLDASSSLGYCLDLFGTLVL